MNLIEDIGPILGIVAFLGFAILALLIVLQAREVRRLREWAGRAPERALEADEADRATADARGEEVETEPGPLAVLRERFEEVAGPRWEELDRRSPVDPRWFAGALVLGLVLLGIATSGFGLGGGDGDDAPPAGGDRQQASGGGGGDGGSGEGDDGAERPPRVEVAVLNATQVDDPVAPVPGVPGLADLVATQVVRPAGFSLGERTNAPAGEAQSVIMYVPEAEDAANELAAAVEPQLGRTGIAPITNEVSALVGSAELVLLVGRDDDTYGQAG